MKRQLFILLGLILIVFTACNLKSDSNFQPDIQFVKNPVANDTTKLNIYYTDQGGVWRLDTLQVGDTVSFQLYVNGFANNLKEFYLTQSTDSSIAKILLPSQESMDSIFLSTSNYTEGKFIFSGSATALSFPFRYVAKKASGEAKITFSVKSDATIDYNQYSFVLLTPIIDKKKVIE